MQETQVQSLGWEDSLEKNMATHSSILVWKNPMSEKPGGLQNPWGHKSRTQLSNSTATTIFKEIWLNHNYWFIKAPLIFCL